MHDIDRTLNEFGSSEMGAGEMGFEFGNAEAAFGGEISSPFNEMQELELASELLSVGNEAELNQFLGNFIQKAGSAIGSFVSSPTGQALGGILKQAAKKALPVVGSAIGGYFGGSTGADVGGRLASTAGNILGLEFQEMNQEDREFEVARRFVRFGGATVRKAAQRPVGTNPVSVARQAAALAAQMYLPGLLGVYGAAPETPSCSCGSGRSGRWYRRGNKIILVGF
jgi:uncharacterized protein (DUF697 family)